MLSKRTIAKITAVLLVFLLVCTFLSRTVYHLTLPNVKTVKAFYGILTHTQYAEGWFEYENTLEIKATGDWEIVETLVAAGDTFQAGQPLLKVAAVDYHLRKSELELELLRAETRWLDGFDDYTYRTAIEDAQASVNQSRTELALLTENPESLLINEKRGLEDTEVHLERMQGELAQAEDLLAQALAGQSEVDISVERRERELALAEAELEEALNKAREAFDPTLYERAISQAQTTYDRASEELRLAEKVYQEAYQEASGVEDLYQEELLARNAARNARDDARVQLDNALEDLEKASTAQVESLKKANTAQVEALEQAAEQAKLALEDALLARQQYIERAQAAVETAKGNVSDGQVALIRAEADMERTREERTQQAEETLADNERRLARAQENLNQARTAHVRQNDDNAAEAAAELELARLKLEAFIQAVPEDGYVKASIDGKVQDIWVKAGERVTSQELLLSYASADAMLLIKFRLPAREAAGYGPEDQGTVWTLAHRESTGNAPSLSELISELDNETLAQTSGVDMQGESFTVQKVEAVPGTGDVEFTAVSPEGLVPVPGAVSEITLSRATAAHEAILPASSVLELGRDEYAIFIVKQRDTLFGTQDYVMQVGVKLLDTNGLESAVSATAVPWTLTDVVSQTSKPLTDRSIVVVQP